MGSVVRPGITWPTWLRAAVLTAAIVGAYLPVVRCGYIWDDDDYLHRTRPGIIVPDDGLELIWTQTAAPQYYPLVFTTFWLEYRLWGFNPIGYHVVNVLLHAANVLLIWRILLRLNVPGAWLAAALFGLHPVHVETVAWVTERKNTMSLLFYLLAGSAYLRFADGRGWRWYGATLVAYAAALLSKTVTCSLPVALLLVFFLKRPKRLRPALVGLLPLFVAGAFMAKLTGWYEFHRKDPRFWEPVPITDAMKLAWTHDPNKERSGYGFTLPMRAIVASRALLFYAGKLVWPHPLAFFYERWDENDELDPNVARNYWPVAVVGALGLAVMACVLTRRWRGVFVGFGFFVATVFPALGFVDLWPMRFSFVADHFQYHASLGLLTLAAAGLAVLTSRVGGAPRKWFDAAPTWAGVGAAVMLMVLGALTFGRIGVFRGEETLWKDTIAKTPTAWYAMNNLGALYWEQGRIVEAEQLFERAIAGEPSLHQAHVNLAQVRLSQGRFEEAEALLRRSIELAPTYMPGYQMLALALIERGRPADALELYERALLRLPGDQGIRAAQARLRARMGPTSRESP